jgi:hypothetical protein
MFDQFAPEPVLLAREANFAIILVASTPGISGCQSEFSRFGDKLRGHRQGLSVWGGDYY